MARVPFRVQSVFFPVPPACTDPPKMWEEPAGRKGVDNPGGLGLVGGICLPLGTLPLGLGVVSHLLDQESEAAQQDRDPNQQFSDGLCWRPGCLHRALVSSK